MPVRLLSCMSLPPATSLSIPIYDFALANEELNEELAGTNMDLYYTCCGKNICRGCIHSVHGSGNDEKSRFCNSHRASKTEEEKVEEILKRVEANDARSICMLASYYHHGVAGFQQDQTRAIELYVRAANLGSSHAHFELGMHYYNVDDLSAAEVEGGDLKKAKFHFEAAAIAGHEVARCKLGIMEGESGNMERALKHLTISASAGHYIAMQMLRDSFDIGFGYVSRYAINAALTAYNNSCAEMRSKERDDYIQFEVTR
jgi:TPR repeat protein